MINISPTGFAAVKTPDRSSVALWAVTPGGLALAAALCHRLDGTLLYHSGRLSVPADLVPERCRAFGRLRPAVATFFTAHTSHVFVMSTGIVVRCIAPLLEDKTRDPAVVVIDEAGRHAISLVSGHIGGANALAATVARAIGATPVITTATDVNALPAVDIMAVEKGLFIENPAAIRHVNMALLEKRPLGLYDPFGLFRESLPGAVSVAPCSDPAAALTGLQPAVFVDDRVRDLPETTLVLRPASLVVGVGCNRHTPADEIHDFILAVLDGARLSHASIVSLASIDLKQDEAGLLAAARRLDLPIRFFSRVQLAKVENIQSPSQMVQKHIGVNSVCEAAALKAAPRGALVVPKRKTPNVTVAVVRRSFIS